MSCTLRMASGVSIMAHSRVLSGARAEGFADAHDVGAAARLRQQDGIRRRRHRRIQVGLAPGRVERVDADDQLARTIAARLDRRADLVARDDLGVGRDGVLQIEDQRIGGNGLGLLQRAGVGARHVEHAAARDGSAWVRSSVVSAQTRQRPCRLPARRTPSRLARPARSATVAQRCQKHRNPNRGYRRCRDRRRRHRRQRRRLFSEHGCRIPWPPHRADRDATPSYREASTARSAGGIRQQFSTPENIAMSQVTLAMFRQLKAIFGRRGGRRLPRAGLPDHGDRRRARRCCAKNVALQQSMGADIALLDAAEIARRFPWLATDGVAAAGFGRTGRRLVRSHEPRHAVPQGRARPTA